MEFIISNSLTRLRESLITNLINRFEISDLDIDGIINIEQDSNIQSNISSNIRCNARIWDRPLVEVGNYTRQCSRTKLNNSDFCKSHGKELDKDRQLCLACYNFYGENINHKYKWEHLGRMDDPVPTWYHDITYGKTKGVRRLIDKINNSKSPDEEDESCLIDEDDDEHALLTKNLENLIYKTTDEINLS